MTQSLGMRATSVGASAVLLGLAVFAAFSVTITLQTESGDPPFTIPVFQLPPPTPPPIARERPQPPPTTPSEPAETNLQPPPQTSDLADASWTPPVEAGPALITNPRWLRQPRDLASYYPSRALAREITGQVVLDCLVDVTGVLNCAVISETPSNWGFAQAALRIARDYRMVPATRDGQAVQGRYRMRVPFEVR